MLNANKLLENLEYLFVIVDWPYHLKSLFSQSPHFIEEVYFRDLDSSAFVIFYLKNSINDRHESSRLLYAS